MLTDIAATVLAEVAFSEIVCADLALDHQHALLLHLVIELADYLEAYPFEVFRALATSSAPIICVLIMSPVLESLPNITDS